MYHHLKRDQRVSLGILLREGLSQRAIADRLGVHHTTISRELKRNPKDNGRYHASHAQVLAQERRQQSKTKERLLENQPVLADTVEALMDPLVSPECIAELLGIHHQSIYAWVYRSRPDLKERLPYRGKKRRRYGGKREGKQGWTTHVRSIHNRQDDVINWEGDSIVGSGASNLITHVERSSLYLDVRKVPNATPDAVHATLKQEPLSGTITYDKGFADAHSPWQRGKNENTNGRLRRPFPKRYDFDTLSDKELRDVVDLMNHTPRKSLGWQMPVEVFKEMWCGSG